MGNSIKNHVISVKVNDETLRKIEELCRMKVNGTGLTHNSILNKSDIIQRGIDLLYRLDLSDNYTFMRVFGSVCFFASNTRLELNDIGNKLVIRDKKE